MSDQAAKLKGQVFSCRFSAIVVTMIRCGSGSDPEVDQQHERAGRGGVLVDGFVAPVGERHSYHGLFSGKKHVSGQNVQVVADLDAAVI
jgi:hypothetical protein